MSSPLRHRDFRLFWTGLLLSSAGSQFTQVAMAWQIYELTDSPLQIGMIGLVGAVPQMIVLLFGGLLADAVNRRKLMMVTQGSLIFVSGALALLTLADHATPARLYTVTVLLALFSSLESPSRQAMVTNLVPAEDLSRAFAFYSTHRQIATIAGPSLAGVALAFAGPALCYAIDAVSWLLMLGSLVLIRTPLPERGGWRTITLDSLRAGFRFVWGHAVIFPFLMMDFGANIFGTVRSLFPIYARDVLAVGPQGLGVLYAAGAAGALLGALGFSVWGRSRQAGRWILFGVTFYGLSLLLFAGSRSFWLSVLLLVGSHQRDSAFDDQSAQHARPFARPHGVDQQHLHQQRAATRSIPGRRAGGADRGGIRRGGWRARHSLNCRRAGGAVSACARLPARGDQGVAERTGRLSRLVRGH
jgi:MFS family permease